MCSCIIFDRVRNEGINEKVGVAIIENKMRGTSVRWFDFMKIRRNTNAQHGGMRGFLPDCR